MLLVQPPPADLAIPADEIEGWIAEALRAAEDAEIAGGGVTPFVLTHVARASEGRALRANIGLIVANARTAGAIAVELAHRSFSS
jgi:pseudouridine-5'-phosphate glycosidase